jgi:hypothetical protein
VNGGWQFGPAPITGGCSGSDPFAALGGGHCVNGGWLFGPAPGGGTSTGGTGSLPICVGYGNAPGPGWIRTAEGGWLPPSFPGVTGICVGG